MQPPRLRAAHSDSGRRCVAKPRILTRLGPAEGPIQAGHGFGPETFGTRCVLVLRTTCHRSDFLNPLAGATFMKSCGIVLVGILVVLGLVGISSYNKLNELEQGVQAGWAQVQNVYQRRADLIPNLVETVKGAANFERDTITAVTEARSRVGQLSAEKIDTSDPEAFKRFQAAQDQLGSALSRLLVVAEAY